MVNEKESDYYAVINAMTNEIENVTHWDGVTPWQPPKGFIAVKCGREVHTGSVYDPVTGTFSNEWWHYAQLLSNPESDG